MGLFERKRHRREDMAMVRRVVQDETGGPWRMISSRIWEIAVFALLTTAIMLICFWGRPPHLPVLIKGHMPKMRYDAPFDFSYNSDVLKKQREEQAAMVPQVFRVAIEESEPTLEAYRKLILETYNAYDELAAGSIGARTDACREIVRRSRISGLSDRLGSSLARIVEITRNRDTFAFVMTESLQTLDLFLRGGIYEESAAGDKSVFVFRGSGGQQKTVITASRELSAGADTIAAREVMTPSTQRTLSLALFEIFRPGLVPNLSPDKEATAKRKADSVKTVKDVAVNVRQGDPLFEPNIEITDFAVERWNAYKRALIKSNDVGFYGITIAVTENLAVAVLIMIVIALYTSVCVPKTPRRRRNLTLAATMILLNLALIRLALDAGESPTVIRMFSGNEVLFYIAPPALAAIIMTVLVGSQAALLAAFLVCSFSSMMIGRNIDVFFGLMLASFVGIVFARNVNSRSGVLKAGVFSGLSVALAVFLTRIAGGVSTDWGATFFQMTGCIFSGLFTGVLALGVLPVLEYFFKITTNGTLLELTDYNHPLLRKLQFIAPGTFHHSVMVANLAERAAREIGANALLCRCGSLYHDIGKMVKPEYFVENQSSGTNPHTELTPSMSALIIKSHVREGVEIAKEYSLPRPLIDIIEQHHGTGLIQYFYHKACQQCAGVAGGSRPSFPGAPADIRAAGEGVDEKPFRYDGPRPRTKEAAIILFADSLEAASRSLKKATPQAIEELVANIANDRVIDGQLNLCPLTMNEVLRVRESLKASLLNMLHSRIQYPGQKREPVLPAGDERK